MKKEFTTTAIFNCNYSCNDTCDFCFNKNFLNQTPELTLEEIKNNYFYLEKKYGLDDIIISGGEPSLYSSFWEMMDFFYNHININTRPSLNTNSLLFSDEKLAKKLFNVLDNSNNPRKQLSLSFSSVNTWTDSFNGIEKMKVEGVKNTIHAGLMSNSRILVPVIITKSNYKILPKIASFLVSEYHRVGRTKSNFTVQLRNLYLGDRWMTKDQEKKTLPTSFSEVQPYVTEFINIILESKDLDLYLQNIPLCLIQDKVDVFSFKKKYKKKKELRMNVDVSRQFSSISVQKFMNVKQNEICSHCLLQNFCSKAQSKYLKNGFFGELKPVIN